MRFFHWSVAPDDASPEQRRNFLSVQLDAIGIGLASGAAPFLPVFLARLGATNSQVGLLSAMPALAGLLLAIQIGSFLQSRRYIVPWFSAGRLLVISSYALTGIVPFFLSAEQTIIAILCIWAAATIPQTMVNIAFSVVMSGVAGPRGRYELMSRRWSLLGLTTSITVAVVGQILVRLDFPFNYQVVFLGLSLGGLISYYYSSRITLPPTELPAKVGRQGPRQRVVSYVELVKSNKPFASFVTRRFVFLTGQALAAPLFPLFYVRVLDASDAAIGLFTTAATATALIGYYVWVRLNRRYGSRFVLLCTTLALAAYPAVTALNRNVDVQIVLSGLSGIVSAGLNLVFFDELMRTVPYHRSAMFVSVAQMLQYTSAVIAPMLSTTLATHVGIGPALILAAAVHFAGFVLFVRNQAAPAEVEAVEKST